METEGKKEGATVLALSVSVRKENNLAETEVTTSKPVKPNAQQPLVADFSQLYPEVLSLNA